MNIGRVKALAVVVAMLSSLSGCGEGEEQEVRSWMEDVRRQTPVSVQKIPEPKKFAPFVYERKEDLDPFSPVKLAAALAKMNAKPGSGFAPDLERRKEALEEFPLDAIRMVGTLKKPGLSYALLQVDKSVFQIRVGNYIGQNFGQVMKITETEVELREIVRDAAGDWVERKATLELQESTK